jgi:YHYH protein
MRTNRSAIWTIALSTVGIAIGAFGAVNLAAQQGGGRGPGGGQGGPPPEMLKACAGKLAGDSCSATGPQGRTVNGSCFAPQGRPLACRPAGGPGTVQGGGQAGGPPPEGGPPPSDQGAEIPSTRADTAAVLCSTSMSQANAMLGLTSSAKWTCSGANRVLASNGVPNHVTGVFPNPNNPNKISAQTISFTTMLKPVARTGTGAPVRTSGYALNGVKFEPGTAGRCPSGVTNPSQCDLGRGTGAWTIEALGQNSFDFGDDMNHAHVQPTGEYHYHGVPEGMIPAQNKAGKAMALVGWASDGFPIYARYGRSVAKSASSPLRNMRTSYRLKAKPDNGRPPISLIPMGAFGQDYEFVKGLGDLDECNGRFDVTPEFPKGIYHYYATDGYPYVQRCVKGTPSANAGGMGPPPGGRPRRG